MLLMGQHKETLNQPVVGNPVPEGLFRSHEAVFRFESPASRVCEQPWIPSPHLGTSLAQDALSPPV